MTAAQQPAPPAPPKNERWRRYVRPVGAIVTPVITGVLIAVIVARINTHHAKALRLGTPFQEQMTQFDALERYGIPLGDAPKGQLRQRGVLLRVNLHAEGYTGAKLAASCHLYDETADAPAGAAQHFTITVTAQPDSDTPCWFPVKRGHTYAGDFKLDIPDPPPESRPVTVRVPPAGR